MSSSMTRSVLVISTAGLVAGSLLVVACSDDPARPSFTADASASEASTTNDSGPPPSDGGVDPDARGPFDPKDEPVVCDASPCVTQIVGGAEHFCARMSDGTVACWGGNAFGALGPLGEDPAPPDGGTTVHKVTGLTAVTQLSAAGSTTCARVDDGGVLCWGDNRQGQLGLAVAPVVADEDPHPLPTPVALADDMAAARVDVGHGTACALLASGKLSCWGENDQAQLARVDGNDPLDPLRGPGVAAIDPVTVTRTVAGSYTLIGLDAVGQLWSWGALAGNEGILSGRVASITPNPTPNRIEKLSKVTSLAATFSIEPPYEQQPDEPYNPPPPRAHACAIADGEVYCWGRSYQGALCTGLPDKEQEPRRAPILETWPQQLAVNDEITCARMTDGTVSCCGGDQRGRLGTGAVGTFSAFFTRAWAFTGHAVQVAASSGAVCALVQGGTVQCWGSNEKGELGRTPDTAPHPSPVKVAF